MNVEPEDPEALANVIRDLMDDPAKCEAMGITARRIGQEQFDRPNAYQKIIRMVDELLNVQR